MQHDRARDHPVIAVSMDGTRVVVRPVGALDDATVEALRVLLEGARAAGQVAVVDFAAADVECRQAALSTSASAGR